MKPGKGMDLQEKLILFVHENKEFLTAKVRKQDNGVHVITMADKPNFCGIEFSIGKKSVERMHKSDKPEPYCIWDEIERKAEKILVDEV